MGERRTTEGVTEGESYAAAIGSDPAEVAAVRRAIRDIAVRHGFADRAGDLALALDELLANAQEHGRPPIRVAAWADGRVVVEVSDAGGGFDPNRVWSTHPPAPLGRRGRGLWIARQLADVVTIHSDERGTTVRLELSPDPHIGA